MNRRRQNQRYNGGGCVGGDGGADVSMASLLFDDDNDDDDDDDDNVNGLNDFNDGGVGDYQNFPRAATTGTAVITADTGNVGGEDNPVTDRRTPVLGNANCKVTEDLELEFLNKNGFRPYEPDRDLNTVPTVMYSRIIDGYYVYDADDPLPYRQLHVFKNNGHSLTVANHKSYVRPFALDLDCVVCHSCRGGDTMTRVDSAHRHLSEDTVGRVLRDVQHELKSLDRRAVTSVWNLECGYHIYSNVMVSVAVHNQICALVRANHRDDPTVIVEVPTFMPLPYSAKDRCRVYTQSTVNDSELDLPLCCGVNVYAYHDNCRVHAELLETYTVVVELVTGMGVQYVSQAAKTRKVENSIPNLLHVTGANAAPGCDYADNVVAYVADIVQTVRSLQISNGAIADDSIRYIDYDRLYADLRFMDTVVDHRDHVNRFFYDFNKRCFDAELDSVFVDDTAVAAGSDVRFVDRVFDKFVYHSAVQFGGLNLQHYVVALHKAFEKKIESDDFYHLVRTMYADVDDPSVRHFTHMYNDMAVSAYPDDFGFILNYMRIYITDGVTPAMNSSEVFDRLLCTRLQTPDPVVFQMALDSARRRDAILNQLIRHMMDVCLEYRFFVYFSQSLYALNNTMFYYDELASLPFMVNWNSPHITSRVTASSMRRAETKFEVKTFCESNEHMVATSVGLFNTVTGLYVSRTTLVPFIKGRYRVVWPVDRPLCPYDRQNVDILELRSTANRVVNVARNAVDELYVKFQFLPSVVGIRDTWDIDNTAISGFFETVEEHKTLPGTLPVVELYPFNTQFVAYVLALLDEYGLHTVCEYRLLCQQVFGYSVKHTTVTGADWLLDFRVKFKCDFKPDGGGGGGGDDDANQLFTVTGAHRPYGERLQSFRSDTVRIEIGDREAVLGVTLVAALVKCSQFRTLCSTFGHRRLPKPSKHFDPRYLELSFKPDLENIQKFYSKTLASMMVDPTDQFEKSLLIMVVQLCISTTFNPVAVRESLNIYSTLVLPVNVLKKIFVLNGMHHKGKSYILDIVMEMVQPSVHALNSLEVAQTRSGLASLSLLLRCNELSTLHPSIVKSLTGNDPLSRPLFYSQKFILNMSGQAMLFAATNVVVDFTGLNKKENKVDQATVNRFHTLTLSGSLVQEHAIVDSDSLFVMTANRDFFMPLLKLSKMDSAQALMWLTYENYMVTRNHINFKPYLNENFEDSLQYRHLVYRNNNVLYDFICQCGFVEESSFYIRSDVLLRVVSRDFIKPENAAKSRVNMNSDYGRLSLHRRTFIKMFNRHYGVDILRSRTIRDIQFKELIDHIKSNMQTEPCAGNVIYEHDVDRRLNVYSSETDRANAKNYFKRNTGSLEPITVNEELAAVVNDDDVGCGGGGGGGNNGDGDDGDDDNGGGGGGGDCRWVGDDVDGGDCARNKKRRLCVYGIVGFAFVNREPASYDYDNTDDNGGGGDDDNDDAYTTTSAGSFTREAI